jgi:hypothetical protein
MKIKHNPIFNTAKIEQIYTDRDGVEVKYVCTTDLRNSDVPADVFYRETPHPQFGNRYFGMLVNGGTTYITDADIVEDFEFGMVENDEGELEYSESHHDYKSFENGNMIDGGRQYIRSSLSGAATYVVRDGRFVEKTELS